MNDQDRCNPDIFFLSHREPVSSINTKMFLIFWINQADLNSTIPNVHQQICPPLCGECRKGFSFNKVQAISSNISLPYSLQYEVSKRIKLEQLLSISVVEIESTKWCKKKKKDAHDFVTVEILFCYYFQASKIHALCFNRGSINM